MPTVWLQERLKLPQPPWWEVVVSTVYMSFFILPYVVAGVLWLRNREEWKRSSGCSSGYLSPRW